MASLRSNAAVCVLIRRRRSISRTKLRGPAPTVRRATAGRRARRCGCRREYASVMSDRPPIDWYETGIRGNGATSNARRWNLQGEPMKAKTGKWIAALAFVMAVTGPVATAFADATTPQTAADHLALAKKYGDEATANRKLAEEHKEMAEAYKKGTAGPSKSGAPNPWAKKMEAHCGKIAK